ncbi:hypothetical protein HPP92_005262 [Vanilla planifolia]|uniref:Uncharacterized protein n=1 Tax=Vanilla planifolia TaxID=51239 RepID=A0A835RYF4_VANPL|nr:hypothetical protein HPP92_005262 [Vanilla planifolia]
MVGGGGIRRDDVAPRISSTNVFAALETLKKKKKSSDKDSKGFSKSKGSAKAQEKLPEPSEVFWVSTPLNKSWADVDDDDDDYYKSAPVLPGWGSGEPKQNEDSGAPLEEETESEDDGLVDGEDDIEDEAEQEPEPPIPAEAVVKKPPPVPVATKDPERQLSKKAQKKKELEELDALLAEFGVSKKDEKGVIQSDNNAPAEVEEQTADGDNETAAVPVESKTSKKKKGKKEKSKESKETQEPAGDADATVTEAMEEPAAVVDMKEKLKKVASTKKKKPGKEMDAAAKIAASEAAARSAKLAAAKKKEKNHYNQQPVR